MRTHSVILLSISVFVLDTSVAALLVEAILEVMSDSVVVAACILSELTCSRDVYAVPRCSQILSSFPQRRN